MKRSGSVSLASPFGSLIGEIREQGLRQAVAHSRARPTREPGAFRPPGPEPDLRLETRAVSERLSLRGSRLLPASVVLHAALVLVVTTVPVLVSEDLPQPTTAVRAFFVEPALAPPPPPPPPPPAATATPARGEPKPVPKEPAAFTAPVEATAIKPEESLDVGLPGGAAGGVEGGVPGGVVGGVVGGLPETKPLGPRPVRVGGFIKEPKKLKNVVPDYPAMARRAHVEGLIVLECTLDTAGRVTDARVLRGIPMLDDAAVAAVKQWVFTPTLLDGVPIPVVMTVTVTFSLKRGVAGP